VREAPATKVAGALLFVERAGSNLTHVPNCLGYIPRDRRWCFDLPWSQYVMRGIRGLD